MTEILRSSVGTALLMLAMGWLVGRLLQALAVRGLKRADATVDKHVKTGDNAKWLHLPPSQVVGRMVFWAVFLLFASVGADALGLDVVSTWTAHLATFMPRFIAGAVVLCIGIVLASLARDATEQTVRDSGAVYGKVLGRTLQLGIVGVAIVIAAEQIGINVTFLAVVTAIVCGSLLAGAALAFALGARTTVGNILAAHYLRQTCRVGDWVKIDGHRGQITEISATMILLEHGSERIMIPAKLFSERSAVLDSVAPEEKADAG